MFSSSVRKNQLKPLFLSLLSETIYMYVITVNPIFSVVIDKHGHKQRFVCVFVFNFASGLNVKGIEQLRASKTHIVDSVLSHLSCRDSFTSWAPLFFLTPLIFPDV